MSDKIATAMAWLRGKQDDFLSREVTYTGVRDGETISATLTVGIGTSQLTQINSLGMEQGLGDFTLANPIEVDRDYVVTVANLRSAGLWPPLSGDLIDDENDISGVTNRYRVMSIPGQSPWRYLRGSYTDQARIHSRFFAPFSELWSDAFTGTNGTNLTSHTPDSPASGTYSGGSGTVSINTNRAVAGSATGYTYFNHGGTVGIEAIVDVCLNGIDASDLNSKHAEFGIGIRCASSGAGLRNGYYCTLRIEYAAGDQTVTRLRIIEGATERAVVDFSSDIDLSTVYRLFVHDDLTRITAVLMDSEGEVSIASVSYATTLYSANTCAAIYFAHHATLAGYATPYMDNLTVTE